MNSPEKSHRLLALAVSRREVGEWLQRRVEQGKASPDWARAYLEQANDSDLIEAAERF